ncbi:MAG: ABC transporter permease subunit [Myxococcales bacterium]|nr:ABC transporter permease subunit [Myxococcales bacterium]
MSWWARPVIRLMAALLLPLAIPALLTAVLWALPGNPAEIICPREICQGTEALAQRWGLDQGPVHYYLTWLSNAATGSFGNSWRVQQGFPVADLIWESLPRTAGLVLFSLVPLTLASALAALDWMPRRLDPLWQLIGLIPAVILALFAAAQVEMNYGAQSYEGWPLMLRLLLGAAVLGFADGALANAVVGTRSTFEEELKQRYVQIAVLRGESVFWNSLPNVLPALVGQTRGRVLHVMSGTVVVEVVLGIPGLGELLFDGTLLQDFGVVLAAAWAFSLMSSALLVVQAGSELLHGVWVRRHPTGVTAGAMEAAGAVA